MKTPTVIASLLVGTLSSQCMVEPAFAQGFSPSYLGTSGSIVQGEGTASELAITGAYRAEGIDVPVSVRGSLMPFNGVEGDLSLSYDWGVAPNTNVFLSGGAWMDQYSTYPLLGGGAEYLVEDYNAVLFTKYNRGFSDNGGFNLVNIGVGYNF